MSAPIVYLDTEEFSLAVEQVAIAMRSAKDSEGRAAPINITVPRIAVELRRLAGLVSGQVVDVKDWDALVKPIAVGDHVVYAIGTPCSPEQQEHNDRTLAASFRQTRDALSSRKKK